MLRMAPASLLNKSKSRCWHLAQEGLDRSYKGLGFRVTTVRNFLKWGYLRESIIGVIKGDATSLSRLELIWACLNIRVLG